MRNTIENAIFSALILLLKFLIWEERKKKRELKKKSKKFSVKLLQMQKFMLLSIQSVNRIIWISLSYCAVIL